ncbi:MAG TPA: serine hydrolase [Pyrinomonadaceae bacterium]|jgi:CubicO group peptidase (beta-lactamase class C family)
MKRFAAFFVVALFFGNIAFFSPRAVFPQTAAVQIKSLSPAQIKEFEEFVSAQMAVDKVPGLSVGYMKGDEIWAKGFGFADLENRAPARAESMYRLASVTKPMTAAAVLQLAEKGKLDLDAEVQTYVPYFPKKNFPVTVRQLLGHLGGISHYKNYDAEGRFKDFKDTRQSIAVFENFDLVAEPGTRYSYSSYGYNLLGAVIEGASGTPYAEYMRENVWRPLAMDNILMDDPREIIPNRVRGYVNVDGRIKNSEFVDISSRFAAGGTRATVVDLLKFGKGISDGRILSKASLDLMFDSMVTKAGAPTNYSAGWDTTPTNGRFVVSHSGGQQETSTYLFAFPSRKLVIAVMSNLEGANTSVYVQKLFELLTGEAWNANAYLADEREKLPLYAALVGAFEEGRAEFEKRQKPLTVDPVNLAQAFNYVNQNLTADSLQAAKAQETLAKTRAGRQFSAGQLFAKIGSYMADKLRQKYGAERLAAYSNSGAIAFFSDYIELYRRDASIPKEWRFNETIEKSVAAWQLAWSQTNTAETRKIVVAANSDFDELGARFRREFAGASVFPNHSDALNAAARFLIAGGQKTKALQAARISAEIYPALDSTNAHYGLALLLTGDKDKGKEFIKRAAAISPNGMASADGLNALAYRMGGAGVIDDALTVLLTAAELYPLEANLFDSVGDFYARKGMNDKAIEYYRKALAVNPGYQNAEKAKEILQKLTTNPR